MLTRAPNIDGWTGVHSQQVYPDPLFVHGNFIFDGGFGIDTDDGSHNLNVSNNVVLTGLYKDGIANSHKWYSGNVELFGNGCFSSGRCNNRGIMAPPFPAYTGTLLEPISNALDPAGFLLSLSLSIYLSPSLACC